MDAANRLPPLLPAEPRTPEQAPISSPNAEVRRRAPVACRRCRRMRTKCMPGPAGSPCDGCRRVNLTFGDCVYLGRGKAHDDRNYRHPRGKAQRAKRGKIDPSRIHREVMEALPEPPVPIAKVNDEWDLLPPREEVMEAVSNFTRRYFQLGFIRKHDFMEALRKNHRSCSPFLLLSILSISARFTPSLVKRYHGAMNAAELFMERTTAMAIRELYRTPSLENCQAFYLLSVAQQGSALKTQSALNHGVAMRMATLMGFHLEDTYKMDNPTTELIKRAESGRRTLWMLHSQDNLHSGPTSPVILGASDITVLLPCSEEDFAAGREPDSRAALPDTPPALQASSLIADPKRSLFAVLVQSHHLWGAISRRALNNTQCDRPWDEASEYAKTEAKLRSWEEGLSRQHRWSHDLHRDYKDKDEDLAYLGVTMVTRICNIVLRKAYLGEIIAAAYDRSKSSLETFWTKMSLELFTNVFLLYEQINAEFDARREGDGVGAQMASFCVYTCGLLSCYLSKYREICPSLADQGPVMVQRMIVILEESKSVWPLADRWLCGLRKFRDQRNNLAGPGRPNKIATTDQIGQQSDPEDRQMDIGNEGSMADSRDPIPHFLYPALTHTAILQPSPPRSRPQPQSRPHDPLSPRRALAPGGSSAQGRSIQSSPVNPALPPLMSASFPFQPPSGHLASSHPFNPSQIESNSVMPSIAQCPPQASFLRADDFSSPAHFARPSVSLSPTTLGSEISTASSSSSRVEDNRVRLPSLKPRHQAPPTPRGPRKLVPRQQPQQQQQQQALQHHQPRQQRRTQQRTQQQNRMMTRSHDSNSLYDQDIDVTMSLAPQGDPPVNNTGPATFMGADTPMQQVYMPTQTALPTNDGYDGELHFYMTAGMPPNLHQAWITGGIYNY